MKTTEQLSELYLRNVAAEQAYKIESERLREMYEQVEVTDCGIIITSMNYPKFKPIFKEVKKNV